MATKTTIGSRDVTAELAYLTRALKAPTLREAIGRLAERARCETWSYEEFLVACLQREVSARESHGGEGRIRAARFNCCGAELSGLKTAHCSACHETFTTVAAFDKHRTGSHANDTRRCLPPASVGLVNANRAYPCWTRPNTREEIAA